MAEAPAPRSSSGSTMVRVPVLADVPPELQGGARLFELLPAVIDLTGAGEQQQQQQQSAKGSSKGKGGFSFDKALSGIKSEAGAACTSRGDGAFEGGGLIQQQCVRCRRIPSSACAALAEWCRHAHGAARRGNVVHLAPSALQGENAEKTLALLDEAQRRANQRSTPRNAAQAGSAGADIASLANVLTEGAQASAPGRRPGGGASSTVKHTEVHKVVQHILEDVGDGEEGGAGPPVLLPQPEHVLSGGGEQGALELVVTLPAVASVDETVLDVGPTAVSVGAPGRYRTLQVRRA